MDPVRPSPVFVAIALLLTTMTFKVPRETISEEIVTIKGGRAPFGTEKSSTAPQPLSSSSFQPRNDSRPRLGPMASARSMASASSAPSFSTSGLHVKTKMLKKHSCPKCNFSTALRHNLYSHLRRHEPTTPEFKCEFCGRKFMYKHVRAQHMKIHMELEDPEPCPLCDKLCSSKAALMKHQSIHKEEDLMCKRCGAKFRQRVNLENHILLHAGWRPYKCDQCDKRFTQQTAMFAHKRIHSGHRPFECQICGRLFTQGAYLLVHQRTHTNERPYQCRNCSKAFTQKEALNRHILIHTGVKPFKCARCFRQFNVKSSLRRHLKLHNGYTSFKCTLCGRSYLEKAAYSRHILSHVSVPPLRCAYCYVSFSPEDQLRAHVPQHLDFEFLKERADKHKDPGAMCALFEVYKEGMNMSTSQIPLAMQYLKQAAKLMNNRALVWLGAIKLVGLFQEFGESIDPHLGAKLLTKAADNSSVDGSFYLAQCYRNGLLDSICFWLQRAPLPEPRDRIGGREGRGEGEIE